MRHIYRNLFIVLVVLLVCGWSIIPPREKLRLGKDLRGGVSLVYSVQNRAVSGQDPKRLIDETIAVLKNRVDPDGLFEISMVAQGNDRIEITMPLPGDSVKALRAKFDAELRSLGEASLTRSRIEQVIRQPADKRASEIERLSNKNAKRQQLLTDAARAFDAAAADRTAYEAETDAAKKDALAAKVAAGEIALEEAVKKVLATALSADDLRHALGLSPRPRQFTDSDGKLVYLPSPRSEAEKKLREMHPDASPEIDRIVQTYDAYAKERKSLDDPEDLKRLLRGAGVLSFRISVKPGEHRQEQELRRKFRELGPRNANADDARWFRLNRIDGWLHSKEQAERLAADDTYAAAYFSGSGYVVENRGGDYYMLLWDTPGNRLTIGDHQDQPWAVSSSYQGRDEIGKPAIHFSMDPVGSKYLGQLTRSNVGNQMAVLLDDEVYTAPNLRSAISSSGQITGEFSQEEINYVVRVLSGGSLQQALSPDPISENTIAPQLGADNLTMGLWSGVYAAGLVSVFMVVYYFGFGLVAVMALAVNAVCILGAMALSKASFTMPGIAGVILTFGMAVDSNVLIYERMREEMLRGHDLKSAARLGFEKALASIVDGNMTNLIVCVVLYYTGTPEIRGFAITMGIGVVSTLFAALVVTRLIIDIAIHLGWRKASMLPMAVPAIQHFITPHLDWLKYRYVFFTISTLYVGLGLAMVFFVQGTKMLDNEFRGGTKVTIQLKTDSATKAPLTLTRQQVEERARRIAESPNAPTALRPLLNAEVLPIDPAADGVTSNRFDIKVGPDDTGGVSDPNAIPQAIVAAFEKEMEVKPALTFVAWESDAAGAPAHVIEKPNLADNIDRPRVSPEQVPQFVGGVAIVLEDMDPRPSLASLKDRLDTARGTPEFSGTLSRDRRIIVVDGDDSAVKTAVILVRDDGISGTENEQGWSVLVKGKEWALVREALTKQSSLAGIQAFSPAIAGSFRADAITATLLSFFFIGIYIWVRFKTVSYALAAVVALIHDVITVIGLLALCEVLYEHHATQGFARALGLLPFKIDLNIVAALLTIAGYSLNDTVIVMDRIRENRGKLPYATASIINNSINQTFSRTLITAGTTLASCLILYFFGGEGMRAFAFALTAGLIFGTYSSVAVAAPIVWSRKHEGEPGLEEQPATL